MANNIYDTFFGEQNETSPRETTYIYKSLRCFLWRESQVESFVMYILISIICNNGFIIIMYHRSIFEIE